MNIKIFFLLIAVIFAAIVIVVPGFSQEISNITSCSTSICSAEGHTHGEQAEKLVFSAQVESFFTGLFDTSLWPPRWECGSWSDFHGWFYIISDLGIWVAYFAIPLIMGFFLFKRKSGGIPFRGIYLLFIGFILACGLTHLLDAVLFWIPMYKLSAFIRFITASVSIGTVFALIKVAPKVIRLKSPDELEKLVKERTDELEKANKSLALEIREKEAARRERKQLLEGMPVIAWIADKEGKVTYVNSGWKEYTGLERHDPLAITGEILHPDDLLKRKIWVQCLKEGTDYMVEHRLRSKKGHYEWFLVKAIPIKDDQGKIEKWIGTSTNIEEQKQNEIRKDTFLNIASHELKTPLTSVRAYIELLKDDFADKNLEPQYTYLNKAYGSTQKLNNLINELLDVSRIQTGKMTLNKKWFDVDELIHDVIQVQQHDNPSHQILVEGAFSGSIFGDRDRLEQVINNLLTNAIKYSPKANKVLVKPIRHEKLFQLDIVDFGIGITNEEKGKLFDQFYRTESAVKNANGLGMGLYIAQEIAKEHAGEITVKSENGNGSTFSLMLPIDINNDLVPGMEN